MENLYVVDIMYFYNIERIPYKNIRTVQKNKHKHNEQARSKHTTNKHTNTDA